MRVVKIYLEHLKDSSSKSNVGYTSQKIPRENLGKKLINLKNQQTIILSSDDVLVVEGKSFTPLKFEYSFMEEAGGYIVSSSSAENDDDVGATILNEKATNWNRFYLVVKYLTDNGVSTLKEYVDLKY